MTKSLFRKQALDKQQIRLEGEVLLLQPISQPLLVGGLTSIVLITLLFLFNAQFARQESAIGIITPNGGVIHVYAQQSGVVKELLVSEGDTVEQGDPIAVLSTSKIMSTGEEAQQLSIKSLQQQIKLLNSKLQRQHTLFANEKQQLEIQKKAQQLEIEHLTRRSEHNKEKLFLQIKQLTAVKKLAQKDYINATQVDETHRQYLELASAQESVLQSRSQSQQQYYLLEGKIDALPVKQQEEIDSLEMQILQLEQQLIDAKANYEFVLRAEQAGTISSLQFQLGQIVSGNTPLASIIPKDSELHAELLIPTQAIGFVQQDQKVSLQYGAFPYQKFGLYQGKVKQISRTALLPNELHNLPISIDVPVYRVTVSLDTQSVFAYGEEFPLQSGMQLQANIRLDERSLFEWLLEPIFSLRGRFS